MADFQGRYPQNVPGQFYVDDQCTDCDACRHDAPKNFTRDEERGFSYVFKQPENDAELLQCQIAFDGCPMIAIGSDGLNPLPPEAYDQIPEPVIEPESIHEKIDPETEPQKPNGLLTSLINKIMS